MHKDKKAYHILVIEDNFGDFVLIEEYLAENILEANLKQIETFQAARKILQNPPGKFDLIFLDLTLPDLSGEKLIVEILELAGDTPVVALTGFSDLDFTIKSLSLGVSDYLLKDELTPTILYKTIVYSIQRKKFTDQIQRSEKRYSDLFQLSPLPMWVFDADTLKFLSINQAAINHYGYSEEEFLALSIADLRPKGESHGIAKELENLLLDPSSVQKNVFRHLKKSGETITVETTYKRLPFNERNAMLVIINDITDRNRHIETIEKQNQNLMEIAWIQSHVVRAPLARLLGLVNLLDTETSDLNAESKKLMGYIRDSAGELDEIIREISRKSETIEHLDKNED
ncbi:PAS domain S-box protein [Algoriphagus aestuariicola]|jgi:PAS domain S-box-containing protein|uniref:PAS domain S-box protein n=1 Tax=Algoriphagus aestuariicola TaxID=1852016 RepID=A0ABS3BPR8_9BACT|nr:PAS domain S-box protein [Algoriphagus aestuariicola]MBN7801280.1 PAS domain S-box protein [Algoriphagus aestuariicola]